VATDPSALVTPPPTGGARRLGRYEVLGRVSVDDTAETFLAQEETALGGTRRLALERLLPGVAAQRERASGALERARRAIQIHHGALRHIYEQDELDGVPLVASEWVDGVSLRDLITDCAERGGVPPEIAIRIAATVAAGLRHAHEATDALGRPLDLVHGHVGADQVLVGYDGQVKLTGLGLARRPRPDGTAPEASRDLPSDARVDVFGLATCLWEALTGGSLFDREGDEVATIVAVQEDEPPRLASVMEYPPEELDAPLRRALAKDPDARSTMAELHDALEAWIDEHGYGVDESAITALMEELYEDQMLLGPRVEPTPLDETGLGEGLDVPGSNPSEQAEPEPRPSRPSPPPPATPAPRDDPEAPRWVAPLIIAALAAVFVAAVLLLR